LVASPGAIKETLVLESADAPTEWDFPMRLNGLIASLNAGSLWLRDSSGLTSNSVKWTNLLRWVCSGVGVMVVGLLEVHPGQWTPS
jgi:hypothetical protein